MSAGAVYAIFLLKLLQNHLNKFSFCLNNSKYQKKNRKKKLKKKNFPPSSTSTPRTTPYPH
jgi:hypothetical protein